MKRILTVFSLLTVLLVSCKKNELSVFMTGLGLDCYEAEILKGEKLTLHAKVEPVEMSDVELVWESSDSEIAAVHNGEVSALEVGNAVISVKAGEFSSRCNVTVLPILASEVKLDIVEKELEIGESFQLNAAVSPDNVDDRTVVWSSTDKSVASVDENGKVKAIAAGKTNIKATVGDVSATCVVTVISPLKIGDFYYSDGTTSSELDPSKTPIGIVFWVGNPSKDDEALRREHPECVNGLVVALNGNERSFWQDNFFSYNKTITDWYKANNITEYQNIASGSKFDDNVNKIKGYNNTKLLELFNADAANSQWPVASVVLAVKYRETVPAPESSSDWYLPSAKELSLLGNGEYEGNILEITMEDNFIDNVEFINERLSVLEGSDLIDTERGAIYWSSTESVDNGFNVYSGYLFSGITNGVMKANYYLNRFVLAF